MPRNEQPEGGGTAFRRASAEWSPPERPASNVLSMPFRALPQRPFKARREADFDGTLRLCLDQLLTPLSTRFRTAPRTLTPERCDRQGAAGIPSGWPPGRQERRPG